MSQGDLNRFWKKVEKTNTCWNWTASTWGGRLKYGQFGLAKGKNLSAHVFSYWIHFGEPIYDVHHKCHNTLCVNPEHLEDLEHGANVRDGYDGSHTEAPGGSV